MPARKRHVTDTQLAHAIREMGICAACRHFGVSTGLVAYRAKHSAIVASARENPGKSERPPHRKFRDMHGQKIAGWTVLERVQNRYDGSARWSCRHVCGAIQVLLGYQLRTAPPLSCPSCRP